MLYIDKVWSLFYSYTPQRMSPHTANHFHTDTEMSLYTRLGSKTNTNPTKLEDPSPAIVEPVAITLVEGTSEGEYVLTGHHEEQQLDVGDKDPGSHLLLTTYISWNISLLFPSAVCKALK